MAFSAIIREIGRSQLTKELLRKLERSGCLTLQGIPRFSKGLVASALAQAQKRPLFVVTATTEEASRWVTQLEAMAWQTWHFYPTSEASPYEPFDPESEMTWGQIQVLADLVAKSTAREYNIAIVATERSLQPHLPPPDALKPYFIPLQQGMSFEQQTLDHQLTQLGYDRVPLVETEGQWSRRGDIVDIFPVASELPVRLEWFGDELEQLREFDPSTQRSLDFSRSDFLRSDFSRSDFSRSDFSRSDFSRSDHINQLILTPTDFAPIIKAHLQQDVEESEEIRRFLGLTFPQPASLLDYLPDRTLIAIDEPIQSAAHSNSWLAQAEEQWSLVNREISLPKIHRNFAESLAAAVPFKQLHLSELGTETLPTEDTINLATRPVPVLPHQFAKLAQTIREQVVKRFSTFVISAQPSRSVALLQEHDCPAHFVPNPRDYPAIDKLLSTHTPIALKYSGGAELEGFLLPTLPMLVVTDREFYGQHSLATPTYVRKRRRAASKQVDPNKLQPGDYVVHRHHGIGKFIKLENLTINNETREYLAIEYADGLLRVAADQLGTLSRFRTAAGQKPQLHKLTGKTWEKTKNKVWKNVKKLAVDLIGLYAQRSQQTGFAYPEDSPWQKELEESFPYQPTPDQLKATQDVKRDLESPRPMDRLVCGDVGFGKTEVAIRCIFKAVTAGKQVALLAPTTILTQQHYHTLKERFAPYPIHVGLLNRFRTPEERREIQKRLATGELDVVVGTQAILSKDVKFRDLGLLVVDEEQRFGVNHKEKIKAMKTQVDVLTLSATPIPRTLYMSLSGVREMSLITIPPPGRRSIKTHLLPYDKDAVKTAIRQELDRGGQVFYVVPRIEGIEEISSKLREMIPGARMAIAHGQMPDNELETIMLRFSSGEADIMVCTTIIESGLDIPRVNTILIEDAQLFGLAQLYQLRGRVGRAGIQAHAWLFYPYEKLSDVARKRLRAIQEFTQLGSGYQLAIRDMEIRGVGNLLGVEQSGQMDAIGFDLYMEMLQEAIREIQGQKITQVDDTQIDLSLTAFIPANYIPDLEQKMSAYRAVASASSRTELTQIAAGWSDRYGTIPAPAQQLLRVMTVKQVAKSLGFSRIKPEGKQHVAMETPMEEPAWNLLKEKLPTHLRSRFVYSKSKVTVRGLAVLPADKQLENLIDWLGKMQGALP